MGCSILAGGAGDGVLALSGLAVVTVGTSAVIALLPDAGGGGSSSSSSSIDAILQLGDLPGGCEIRPFVAGTGGASGGMMLVGASLNGGYKFTSYHTLSVTRHTSHFKRLASHVTLHV